MTYSLALNPQAQLDTEHAYSYYFNKVSPAVADFFYQDLQESYDTLEINPYYEIKVKNYRELPLKKFPFLLFFEVIEAIRIQINILNNA